VTLCLPDLLFSDVTSSIVAFLTTPQPVASFVPTRIVLSPPRRILSLAPPVYVARPLSLKTPSL